MSTHFFGGAGIFFPIHFSNRDFLKFWVKHCKLWTKPTSYEVNHNITNFDLKQKNVFENQTQRQRYKTVFLLALMRERTTIPWAIVNDIKSNKKCWKNIELSIKAVYIETLYFKFNAKYAYILKYLSVICCASWEWAELSTIFCTLWLVVSFTASWIM